MTTATIDRDQAALDAEDADAFRRAVRKLADAVRNRQREEARRRDALRADRKEARFADARLSAVSEARDDGPAADWLREANAALRRVEAAKEAEAAARQSWTLARELRQKAQDELRVRWRQQFERLPLIDGAAAWNGGVAKGDPADAGPAKGMPDTDTLPAEASTPKRKRKKAAPEPEPCGAYLPNRRDRTCDLPAGHAGFHRWPAESPGALRSVEGCACGPDCPPSCACGCHPLPAPAAGKLFPDPPPEPEPALAPEADAGWRDDSVSDLRASAHITATLELRGVATMGQLADRLAGQCIPGLSRAELNWLADEVNAVRAAAREDAAPQPAAVTMSGWDWPGGLTDEVLRKSYIHGTGEGKKRRPPSPFEWDGRLWVMLASDGPTAEVCPLVPAAEFKERWPGVALTAGPKSAAAGDREGELNKYHGVLLKVDRKEYAVAPAGEGRTLVRPPAT